MLTQTICSSCFSLNRVPVANPGKSPICGKCKTVLPFYDGVSELTDHSLQQLISKSTIPVIVDFWAPWCGPCRAFAPTFKAAASELGANFIFAKLDTQEKPQSSHTFQIRSIPTLMKFQKGREVKRISGALAPGDLMRWVKE